MLTTGAEQTLYPTNATGAAGLVPSLVATANLTFEQQKEMLMLQLKHDEMIKKAEIEKQLAVEKLRYQTEQTKLSLQQYKLDLIKSGQLVTDGSVELESSSFLPERSEECFDVLGNLRLLPKFNERDPETFFSLFERVAETRKWPESAQTLMLQCALTGRAQEAYSSLSFTDSQNYLSVKFAVLKAYELVPEAYRQRFRTWRKAEKQTHLEFARDLTAHFTHWCSALNVDCFQDLCDLIVLEQFKNSIPDSIATHVGEQKVKTAMEAAALADDYVLTHRRNFGDGHARNSSFAESVDVCFTHPSAYPARAEARDRGIRNSDKVCNFCHKKGHWKADCYALKSKSKQPVVQGKGACLAVSAQKMSVVGLDRERIQ